MTRSLSNHPRFYANVAPGVDFDQHNPEQFNAEYLRGWMNKLDADQRKVGLSFVFSLLNGPPASLRAACEKLRLAADQTGISILPTFDVQNWWDYRRDLWNWFDPGQPGFNPDNRDNVEWTGPSRDNAVSVSWRNWGSQIRVAPPPNLRSRSFRAAAETVWMDVVRPWAKWLHNGSPGAHVCPGVKIGWEASIGVNAFIYPGMAHPITQTVALDRHDGLDHRKGLFSGCAEQGWAALHSAGKTLPTRIALPDVEWIVGDYLSWLTRMTASCGLDAKQIFTHAGGQYAPYALHTSHSVGRCKGSTPGFSLYNTLPKKAGDLLAVISKSPDNAWCVAEWMSFAATPEAWADDVMTTLLAGNCRFIAAYNAQDLVQNVIYKRGVKLILGQL